MKLQRLRVEQLRQFRAPFELAGLDPGLNLLVGPNEAGKSTLVRALRAAFFERHRSTTVDDLLPWGEPSAAPDVEVDFTVGDTAYRLRKRFLHRKRCELRVGSRVLDGDDAEQHLAQLLGFQFAARGASRPEHWGIPGLLWIEQGGAQELAESVSHAGDHLRQALEKSVTEIASSQGDTVIGQVRAQRELLLTSTGKPRAAYADAIAESDAATGRVAELDARIAQYRQQVDRLGELQREHTADLSAKPWERAQADQQLAQAQLASLQTQAAHIDSDKATLRQLEQRCELLRVQRDAVTQQEQDLATRALELQNTRAELAQAQAADTRWTTARADADRSMQDSNTALALARQQELRADLLRREHECLERAAALAHTIGRAEAELAQLQAHRALAGASAPGRPEIDRLRDQHQRLGALRIRRQAVATRVQFELIAPERVTLSGENLSGTGERLLTTPTVVDIADVGKLTITPGGTDLGALARDEAALLAEHQALLQRLEAADLEDAETRFGAAEQARRDADHAARLLASLAPEGLDLLRSQHAQLQARAQQAQRQRASLGEPMPGSAELSLAQAEALQELAASHLQKVTQQADAARDALTGAQARCDAAQREHDALHKQLADPSRLDRTQASASQLAQALAQADTVRQHIDTRQAALDAARPDILTQDVSRLQRSAEQSLLVLRERQSTMALLQGKLEEAGAQGLEEERARQQLRCDDARRRRDELRLRAEALDLLLGLLESHRSALTQRLQAPLQAHVQHYLQLLFPRATLDIGANLTPGRLTRAGPHGAQTGPVAELSYGAREQMGVISRLAYADLLKAAGRPTLVILDDALVHSDEQRLEQMKRILFDAAQRHQVLLFTCHPQAWRALGAIPRRIASGSTGADA